MYFAGGLFRTVITISSIMKQKEKEFLLFLAFSSEVKIITIFQLFAYTRPILTVSNLEVSVINNKKSYPRPELIFCLGKAAST